LKGYNARQLRKEFPDKEWTKNSINRLLKKFRGTGTVDRHQGSGRREVPARMKTLTR